MQNVLFYCILQRREHSSGNESDCEREAPGSIPDLGNTLYPACLGLTQAVKISISTARELTCDGLTSRLGGIFFFTKQLA